MSEPSHMSTSAPPTYRNDTRRGCPRCSGSLEPNRHDEMPFDECAQCGGVCVPRGTLHRVSGARESPIDLRAALPDRPLFRETAVRYLQCPACEKVMNRRVFARVSGVIVDVCREDGVWFDAGELQAALDFVVQGGLEKARRHEEIERDEQRRQARARTVVARSTVASPTLRA